MSSPLVKHSACRLVCLTIILCCARPSLADDKDSKYTESGTVLSTSDKHGHSYQVATDSKVYLLLCVKVRSFQLGMPECKVGNKPIATGDTVRFRVDKDWAYLPAVSGGEEEQLRILTTELKEAPKAPTAASSASAKQLTPGTERGVVIGTGVHVQGQKAVGWVTNPAAASVSMPTTASAEGPVMPTGPVAAIPVTGGPPVTVIPIAPTSGGVITGVPVTGGAPITAIPTAPVAGVPVGRAPGRVTMGGGSAPRWVHVLRVQAGDKIYQLECSTKPCAVGSKEIELADAITIRTDKKWAYVGCSQTPIEEKYKILSVDPVGAGQDSKAPPDSKPQPDSKTQSDSKSQSDSKPQ